MWRAGLAPHAGRQAATKQFAQTAQTAAAEFSHHFHQGAAFIELFHHAAHLFKLFEQAVDFLHLHAGAGSDAFFAAGFEDFRATALLREKAAHVVISDGGAGAWFDGEFVAAPKVDVVDTTAAGDTLLAEYCWRRFGDGEVADPALPARWAVAAGSAACTMPGGAPPSGAAVARLSGILQPS